MTRHTHTTHTYIILILHLYDRRQEPRPRDCGSRPPPPVYNRRYIVVIIIYFICTYDIIFYTYNRYTYIPVYILYTRAAVVRLGSASKRPR